MNKDFWKNIPKPIIGVSPMDGYTDSAFRRVCKLVNPNVITVTEFTSADGLTHGAKRLQHKLWFHPSEQPVFAQIFGKNINGFIRATKWCQDQGFAGIDLNMGCPSKKVVKSEHGIALRKTPDHAFKLIEAVSNATHLPVSVKTRLGWSDDTGLIEFCKGAEQAGANMICIHARTYMEPYNVPAQLELLYELKKCVSIPIIGNGGIISYQDGLNKLGTLDGFYIGQASIGNPWVFTKEGAPIKFSDRLPVIKKHADWLIEHKGEFIGTREIRKHLLQYVKGLEGAKSYRSRIVHVENLKDIYHVLDEICEKNIHFKHAPILA